MAHDGDIIYKNILENMKDGVMTIDFDSQITTFNPAAESILGIKRGDILNKNYGEVFLEFRENDNFNQTIFDAIYESSVNHFKIVKFNTGQEIKILSLTTSFYRTDDRDAGVIAVFSDITELTELNQIKKLNIELEKRNHFIRETFGRYLSDEIVTSIIETPEGLELGGKKQTLTIMMTDLRGFTSLSEGLTPETVVSMLNNYLGVMTDILLKYGGTIDEFIGDAILAIFGAPIWSFDHAERAVACALEMQIAMDRVNEWNSSRGFPLLDMGIGINTGDVVVGNIGSAKRAKYGIVGSNVNLTSRIESYTVGGQIFISGNTFKAAEEILEVRDSIEVSPKGVAHTVNIYDVVGIAGGYKLRLRDAAIEMKRLPAALKILFSIIDEKNIVRSALSAELVEFSIRETIIRTESSVRPFTNLKIEIPDKDGLTLFDNIYCKVVSISSFPMIKIRFTSIPKEAKKYLLNICL